MFVNYCKMTRLVEVKKVHPEYIPSELERAIILSYTTIKGRKVGHVRYAILCA